MKHKVQVNKHYNKNLQKMIFILPHHMKRQNRII